MKPGAKRSEQAQIYSLMQQGFDVTQISKALKIYPECVKRFMEHFKTTKNVPRTSAFASVKEGMPRLAGMNRVAGLQHVLDESKAENAVLTARVAELEAKFNALNVQEPDDGLG